MGLDIDKTSFSHNDYCQFKSRLNDNLLALQVLLNKPGFGAGEASIGAELELYIVDENGRPLLINEELLAAAADPLLTPELNLYNLEYNLAPQKLGGRALFALENDICQKLEELNSLAMKYKGRMVMCGILPTLCKADFGSACMTNRNRYHALVNCLIERRGSRFRININGDDPLQLDMGDVTLEGANTSFQIHYRVEPEAYADTYNSFQLVMPLVLGVAVNSPSLLGHLLWQETRIPLFKQAIDTRKVDPYRWHPPPRVHFGNGWIRQGAFELFCEAVRTYEPLLPISASDDPFQSLQNGDAPSLHELRLHLGSVWLWNRPVYDHNDGGHLRIEMRALPAGPTPIDMIANSALLIGLSEAVRSEINNLLPALPFYLAEHNFYRAAQFGLQAKLLWPDPEQNGCREVLLCDVLRQLLPDAKKALLAIGIAAEDTNRYMTVIEDRLESGQTGSLWQRRYLARNEKQHSRDKALHMMLESMIENARGNRPVSEWDVHAQ